MENIVYYDLTSPTGLRWSVDIYTHGDCGKLVVSKGDKAGSLFRGAYGQPSKCAFVFKGKRYSNHRVIWEMFNDPIPDNMVVDHIDGNPWNNDIANLELKTIKGNSRNTKKSSRNNSGIVGVSESTVDGNFYSVARWYDESGKACSKSFSHKKFGAIEAQRLAKDYREKMIEELNSQGAGYTERHGT